MRKNANEPPLPPVSSIWRWENNRFFDEPPQVMARAFYGADYRANLHIHDFIEINVIMDGEGWHFINQRCFPVRRGDVFILPPGYVHGYAPISSLGLYHILLHRDFFPAYALDFLHLPAFPMLFTPEPIRQPGFRYHLRADDMSLEGMRPQIDALSACYGDTSPEGAVLQNSLGVNIVGQLCRLCREKYLSGGWHSPMSTAVLEAVHYMKTHYTKKLNIDALCSSVGVSRATLFRYFEHFTGTSPTAYFERYRLCVAQELLRKTTQSVAEIATACGFYDSAHFIRRFYRAEGITPGCYRARLHDASVAQGTGWEDACTL